MPVILILFVLIFTAAPVHTAAAESVNSCIECHRNLPETSYAGHKFSDYTGSVHDRNGVRCDACHGGNALKSDKTTAHNGVLKSGDSGSAIYYRNLPQTCGKCHSEELIHFSRSRHYAELKSTGKGPSCVTCHGSMGTFILSSGRIREFCTVCHNFNRNILPNIPRETENVLFMMEVADTIVTWSEEYVNDLLKVNKNAPESEKQLSIAMDYMKKARLSWHTFRMEDVTANIRKAFSAATKARDGAKQP